MPHISTLRCGHRAERDRLPLTAFAVAAAFAIIGYPIHAVSSARCATNVQGFRLNPGRVSTRRVRWPLNKRRASRSGAGCPIHAVSSHEWEGTLFTSHEALAVVYSLPNPISYVILSEVAHVLCEQRSRRTPKKQFSTTARTFHRTPLPPLPLLLFLPSPFGLT